MPGGGKGGGSSTSTVTVNNGPISVDSDSTVDIVGLDNVKVTLAPIDINANTKSDSTSKSDVNSTSKADVNSTSKADVTSDSKSAVSVDLKPVALDVCLNSSSKLPHGEIHQPFSFHLGLTWGGMEFFGVNFGGESRVILQDLPKRPAIDWPAQQNAAASCRDESLQEGRDRGLRVRIK